MMRSELFHTTILVLLLVMATVVAATPLHDSGTELRQSVIALDRARSRAVHDLTQKQQNATLNAREQRDYEKFITFLSAKIGEYCHQLITEEGETAASGLPCPAGGQVLFDTQTDPIVTSAEQVADLDKVLAESLGQYDESLLKEEERLAARQPRDRETGYGYGHDSSNGGQVGGLGESSGQDSGSGQTSGAGTMPDQDSEGGETTSASSGTEMGGSTTGSGDRTGAVPGKGTGSIEGNGSEQTVDTASQAGQQELETGYDDIVARQLREAAEKETDPELKKKLWEEYRKYKEGVR
jgi:hypothetical protein